MKLICLNIWDARIFDPLMKFFENNQETDIFCLQEVFNGDEPTYFRGDKRINGFKEISKRLPNYEGYFAVTEKLDEIPLKGMKIPYGLAIFVKKGIKILSHHHEIIFGKEVSVNDDGRTHKRVIQTICIDNGGKELAISNVHGLWNGQGKTDTPDRIEQSNKIKNHINNFKHPVLLVGDFNLLPETESLAIVAKGMRDLIKENNVTSTRSSLYTKHEKPVLFADYVFASPEIEMSSFKVLNDVVSDHLPLSVEIK